MEKLIKVKFRKSHPGFAYFAGDIGTMSDENAAMLLNSGHIMLLPDDDNTDAENTLPEDMPGRDNLFAAGFDSAEKVKEAGDSLLDVNGIGKGTLGQLKKYFEKG